MYVLQITETDVDENSDGDEDAKRNKTRVGGETSRSSRRWLQIK